jgi:hypothetical protein
MLERKRKAIDEVNLQTMLLIELLNKLL